MDLAFWDVVAFVAFLAAVIGISLYASRKEDNSEDYFLAGRSLFWWLIGFSLIASNISTEHFVGMAGQGFGSVGLAVASYEWVAAVTLVVVALFLLPLFLRLGIYTMPEFLEHRYGPAARVLMAVYMMVAYVGVAIAAGELVSNWEWVGGGQGIALPVYPGDLDIGKIFFYFLFAAIGVSVFIFVRWLYGTRFGAAINAIRDDEEKADAMGIHTLRYKLITWAMAAFFVGMAGGISAFQLIHFEPLESAYQTINLGIFMVVCVLLGGKGTLWGPVVGAILFHVFKEVTWNYFLGWQWVALGALIVVTVVYFQDGVMGWLMHKRPEWFGIRVDDKASTQAKVGAA